MRKTAFSIYMLIALLGACTARIDNDAFSSARKVMLLEDGPAEFFYWEFDRGEELRAPFHGTASAVESYRDSLRMVLGAERYDQAVLKEFTQDLNTTALRDSVDGDAYNAALVHTGSVGKIRDMNFLEASVLNYQLTKYPLFSRPTEFHAFIAEHEEQNRIRTNLLQ